MSRLSASEQSRELRLELNKEELEKLIKLSEKLKSSPERVIKSLVDVLSDYSDKIGALGSKLKVKDEVLAESVFEELVFYGVVVWEEIVNKVLDSLGASGCYELHDMEFEPVKSYLGLEFVALERCDLKADVVVVKWDPNEVVLEVFYYLEEKPAPQKTIKTSYEWFYEPDEHAVIIRVPLKSLLEAPKLADIDVEVKKLGI